MKTNHRTALVGLLTLVAAELLAAQGVAQGQDLSIAIFNARTGPYAFGGVPIHNGEKLALEQAEQRKTLGNVKITIVEGDTAGDKGQTINLVNRFAQRDNVLMILGPTAGPEATAAAPVANELQVPLFTSSSSNAVLAAGTWSFKVASQATDIMTPMAKYAVAKLGIKSVSLVFDQGNDAYTMQKNAFRDYVKGTGVKIVSEDGIVASDTNFLALATKIAAKEIDAVQVSATAEQSANLFLQLRQAGLDSKVRFIGVPTHASPSFIKTGGKAVEGTYMSADYSLNNPSPLNADFIKAYKARYNADPDALAALGYTVGQLAVQAIKNAGPNPDRARVREALSKLNHVPVILGDGAWSVDAGRNPTYGAALLVVRKGEFVLAQ